MIHGLHKRWSKILKLNSYIHVLKDLFSIIDNTNNELNMEYEVANSRNKNELFKLSIYLEFGLYQLIFQEG